MFCNLTSVKVSPYWTIEPSWKCSSGNELNSYLNCSCILWTGIQDPSKLWHAKHLRFYLYKWYAFLNVDSFKHNKISQLSFRQNYNLLLSRSGILLIRILGIPCGSVTVTCRAIRVMLEWKSDIGFNSFSGLVTICIGQEGRKSPSSRNSSSIVGIQYVFTKPE